MYRWGLGLATLAVGLVLAPSTPHLAVAKPGRVVRIERPTRRPGKAIRVCHFTMSRAQMTCISADDLEIGERVSVLAEDGSFERVEITAIRPSQLDTCRLGHAVDVDLKILESTPAAGASAANGNFATTRFAVRGVNATAGISKLLTNNGSIHSPSGKSDENVFMAADIDGDGRPDLIASLHGRCDQVRESPSWVPAGKVVTSWCIDYWRRDDDRSEWTRSNSEFVHFCQ